MDFDTNALKDRGEVQPEDNYDAAGSRGRILVIWSGCNLKHIMVLTIDTFWLSLGAYERSLGEERRAPPGMHIVTFGPPGNVGEVGGLTAVPLGVSRESIWSDSDAQHAI